MGNHSLITGLSNKSVEFVPISNNVNIEALKAGDKDPLEVVVEVPATKSKRGWNYTAESIKDIVRVVNESTLNGFLGHQKSENVDTEFPDIQTHWVGAVFDENSKIGYFRGLIDPDAHKLKRWIRSKRIKQVSIYGQPKLQQGKNGTDVVGYSPLSIDWTPLDRCGMPTRIVASGEMSIDYFTGEFESTDNQDNEINVFISSISGSYNNLKVLETDKNNKVVEIAFKDNGEYKTKKLNYGNINKDDKNTNLNKGGNEKVEKSEILKNLRTNYLEGTITDAEIGEILKLTNKSIMDASIASEVGEMSVEQLKEAKTAKEELTKTKNKEQFDKVFKEVVTELVTGEQAQKFITETFKTKEIEKDKIKGEMEEYLKLESIKNVLAGMASTSKPNSGNNSGGIGGSSSSGYLADNKFLKPRV